MLFFKLLKARPSTRRKVQVAPGARQRIRSEYLGISLCKATSLADSVVVSSGAGESYDDGIGFLTSWGCSASVLEKSLERWTQGSNLVYFIGDRPDTGPVTDVVTAMASVAQELNVLRAQGKH